MKQTGLTFADLRAPLLEAVQYCPEAALYMLKHGTPPDEPPGRGITPLHSAVHKREGDTQLVRALLESGADVNARSSSGHTPLFLARRWGSAEVVRILLDYGAKE
ncbi:MAG: ankyrin repeat domain-containing protein [Nitrospira sp.]|nr:ankyrin repeat domain-containing protein [Nitrospira sp.]